MREEIFYSSFTRAQFSSFFILRGQSIISLPPFLCFFMCWIDSLSFRLFRSLSSFPFKRGGKGMMHPGGARVCESACIPRPTKMEFAIHTHCSEGGAAERRGDNPQVMMEKEI